jgi:hypothetical protein
MLSVRSTVCGAGRELCSDRWWRDTRARRVTPTPLLRPALFFVPDFCRGDGASGNAIRTSARPGDAGAFRSSELVALNVKDPEESELGFKVTVRHSKTDIPASRAVRLRGAKRPGRSCGGLGDQIPGH